MPCVKPKAKFNLSSALILAGLILLGYAGSQYGMMHVHQRRLERVWETQQRKPPYGENVILAPEVDLTRLSIPRIEFSAIIGEGTGHRQLMLGPGHMLNTAAPGTMGNSVITAHRDTFFRHIAELRQGDQVLIQRSGKVYAYEVAYKKVVMRNDISATQPSGDTRLTLVTCYPIHYIGPAPERLIVVAKLVSPPAESLPEGVVPPAAPTVPRGSLSKAALLR